MATDAARIPRPGLSYQYPALVLTIRDQLFWDPAIATETCVRLFQPCIELKFRLIISYMDYRLRIPGISFLPLNYRHHVEVNYHFRFPLLVADAVSVI